MWSFFPIANKRLPDYLSILIDEIVGIFKYSCLPPNPLF